MKSYPHADLTAKGWFRLADSQEVPPGTAIYVQALGKHFALFRGQDGIVRCLDAYCVHLGANLAIGGQVVDNCLQCPFHKWKFDGKGKCTEIPYQEKIPANTSTRAYHVHEYYGMILVWNSHKKSTKLPKFSSCGCGGEETHDHEHSHEHSAGEERKETVPECHEEEDVPEYYPPSMELLLNGSMVHRGNRTMTINMHLREFAENSTDFMVRIAVQSALRVSLVTVSHSTSTHCMGT